MRPTMTLLACSVVAVCSLISTYACGCDTAATASAESDCVVTDREGRRGVWFSLETADMLRREHEAAPVVAAMLSTYQQIAILRTQEAALRESEGQALRQALRASARGLEKAREELQSAEALVRSPWLWTPIAFAAGVVLSAVVVVELHR